MFLKLPSIQVCFPVCNNSGYFCLYIVLSIIVTPTLYTTELEAGVNDDITIKAGQSHAIPIHLDAPGIVLCWEFASAPKVRDYSNN